MLLLSSSESFESYRSKYLKLLKSGEHIGHDYSLRTPEKYYNYVRSSDNREHWKVYDLLQRRDLEFGTVRYVNILVDSFLGKYRNIYEVLELWEDVVKHVGLNDSVSCQIINGSIYLSANGVLYGAGIRSSLMNYIKTKSPDKLKSAYLYVLKKTLGENVYADISRMAILNSVKLIPSELNNDPEIITESERVYSYYRESYMSIISIKIDDEHHHIKSFAEKNGSRVQVFVHGKDRQTILENCGEDNLGAFGAASSLESRKIVTGKYTEYWPRRMFLWSHGYNNAFPDSQSATGFKAPHDLLHLMGENMPEIFYLDKITLLEIWRQVIGLETVESSVLEFFFKRIVAWIEQSKLCMSPDIAWVYSYVGLHLLLGHKNRAKGVTADIRPYSGDIRDLIHKSQSSDLMIMYEYLYEDLYGDKEQRTRAKKLPTHPTGEVVTKIISCYDSDRLKSEVYFKMDFIHWCHYENLMRDKWTYIYNPAVDPVPERTPVAHKHQILNDLTDIGVEYTHVPGEQFAVSVNGITFRYEYNIWYRVKCDSYSELEVLIGFFLDHGKVYTAYYLAKNLPTGRLSKRVSESSSDQYKFMTRHLSDKLVKYTPCYITKPDTNTLELLINGPHETAFHGDHFRINNRPRSGVIKPLTDVMSSWASHVEIKDRVLKSAVLEGCITNHLGKLKIFNLIMSFGKTDFIVPMLAHMYSQKYLPVIILTDTLFENQAAHMRIRITEYSGLSCSSLKLDSVSDTRAMLLYVAQFLDEDYAHGCVITTATSLLFLLTKVFSASTAERNSGLVKSLEDFFSVLNTRALAIIDEVDSIFDPTREVNVGLDEHQNLDATATDIIKQCLNPSDTRDPNLIKFVKHYSSESNYRHRVRYGFSSDLNIKYAVPYSHANTPVEGSRFSNYYAGVVLTCMCYIRSDFSDPRSEEIRILISGNEVMKAAFKCPNSLTTEEEILRRACGQISHSKKEINSFYLDLFGSNLHKMFSRGFGFSGTLGSDTWYPKASKTCPRVCVDTDIDKPYEKDCKKMYDKIFESVIGEARSTDLIEILDVLDGVCAVIDCGAFFAGSTPAEVAGILCASKKSNANLAKISSVTYLVDGTHRTVDCKRVGTPVTYYDQKHCVGTDMPIVNGGVGIVLVDCQRTTEDIFVQACMRMRGVIRDDAEHQYVFVMRFNCIVGPKKQLRVMLTENALDYSSQVKANRESLKRDSRVRDVPYSLDVGESNIQFNLNLNLNLNIDPNLNLWKRVKKFEPDILTEFLETSHVEFLEVKISSRIYHVIEIDKTEPTVIYPTITPRYMIANDVLTSNRNNEYTRHAYFHSLDRKWKRDIARVAGYWMLYAIDSDSDVSNLITSDELRGFSGLITNGIIVEGGNVAANILVCAGINHGEWFVNYILKFVNDLAVTRV